jgi:hypothetical protein
MHEGIPGRAATVSRACAAHENGAAAVPSYSRREAGGVPRACSREARKEGWPRLLLALGGRSYQAGPTRRKGEASGGSCRATPSALGLGQTWAACAVVVRLRHACCWGISTYTYTIHTRIHLGTGACTVVIMCCCLVSPHVPQATGKRDTEACTPVHPAGQGIN